MIGSVLLLRSHPLARFTSPSYLEPGSSNTCTRRSHTRNREAAIAVVPIYWMLTLCLAVLRPSCGLTHLIPTVPGEGTLSIKTNHETWSISGAPSKLDITCILVWQSRVLPLRDLASSWVNGSWVCKLIQGYKIWREILWSFLLGWLSSGS